MYTYADDKTIKKCKGMIIRKVEIVVTSGKNMGRFVFLILDGGDTGICLPRCLL